jgi:hypothetical protein
MNARFPILAAGLISFVMAEPVLAQKVTLGDVLVVATPSVKPEIDAGVFEAHMVERYAPSWNVLGDEVETHFFRADRGKGIGSYWMVWSFATEEARRRSLPSPRVSGFSDDARRQVGDNGRMPAAFVADEGGYTDYVLIGADRLAARPAVELLGVHYIQIRPDRAEAFDAFVRDKLHPAVVGKIPGMDLLYYKGVRGANEGRYLLIFAIETHEARARYWPTGASETQALKEAFAPLKDLAQELKTYEAEGTYLKEDSGAAASIFESLEWTDFAILK